MAKYEKITDHAKKVKQEDYRAETWQCKHCSKKYNVWYQDFGSLRAHMRRVHPIQYKPYTIEEEAENDHLSVLST